jgi:shikimate kinase
MDKVDKIFLVGFMGSGKSTLGRKLAKLLGYEVVDLDKLIELEVGMSISDYFQHHGEDAFRQLEYDMLRNMIYPDKVVFATGGGTPCYFDTMEWMNRSGVTIYISLNVSALVNRLKNAKSDRPLIKDMKEDELVDFVTKKLAERAVFYEKAKFMVSGIDLTAEKLAHYLHMIN